MKSRWQVLAAMGLVLASAAPARADEQVLPVPRDAVCGPLPAITAIHFAPGEELDYDIDVLGANAARMELLALPREKAVQPLRVRVKTNTFFNKVRKVKAEAKSYLDPRDLHPNRYFEDAMEDD